MYQQFLNKPQDDKRTPNQKALSAKLTQKLTQLNLKRIQASQSQKIKDKNLQVEQELAESKSKQKNKRQLFICISGIPPFAGEFENFSFPGEVLKIVLPGYESGISEQQRYERALKSDLNILSVELNQKIDQYPSDYQMVFVCHSYGTYIASYFFKNFFQQKKDRIKGIIELGGGPIRVYKVFQAFLVPTLPLSKEFIIENLDVIYEKFLENHKKTGNKHVPIKAYSSKYHILSSVVASRTQNFNQLFEMNKKMPKILKLFIYGEKDYIFDDGNHDEKSIHILYHPDAQLNEQYEKQLSAKFTKIHNEPVKKLQQKFVYKLPQGKHSLHMQKSLTPVIQKLIDDYLQLIF